MTDNMTYGRVLYDNAIAGTDVDETFFNMSETDGFPEDYCRDWKDWTFFRVETVTGSGGTQGGVRWDNPDEVVIDTFCWFMIEPGNPATSLNEHQLRLYEYDGGFTEILSARVDLFSDGYIGMHVFDPVTIEAGNEIAVQFVNTNADFATYPWDVRQLMVGERLDFPIGQHVGIAPAAFQRQFASSNNIAVGGSILGRDVVRANKSGVIELQYLNESFIEDDWVPFAEHAQRRPFFYAWDPTDHSQDVVFAAAVELPNPTNEMPTPKMEVRMPWVGLSE